MTSISLKTLDAFIVLADELHFGRAAQQCGISQPAMSRLLRELEKEVGTKLLARTSREVSLTSAGKGFLDSARKAVAYADMAVRAARAGTVNGIDSLRVGMGIGVAQPNVGRLLARFKQAHPETRVTLCQLDERSIGKALSDRDIDVAIAWEVSIPSGLSRHYLSSVPMRLLVPTGHPLEKDTPVSMAALGDYPLILPARDRQPIIYKTYLRYAAQAGFEPKIAIDVANMFHTLAMVAGGVGVGNAPMVAGLYYPGVSILEQTPHFDLHYELVWTYASPPVESLLEICQALK